MAATPKMQFVAEPGVPQIVITREFDSPLVLLYRVHIDPELLVQWLGPRRLTTHVERWDIRDGGTWRYISRDGDSIEYGFHGVFHGTPSPEGGIVQTFEFEGTPGHVSLQTLTFQERSGKTLVRVNAVFQSVEDRDAMLESGMEDGFNQGYERLDKLLTRLAQEVNQ